MSAKLLTLKGHFDKYASNVEMLEYSKSAIESYLGDRYYKFLAAKDVMAKFGVSLWEASAYIQKADKLNVNIIRTNETTIINIRL